MNETIPEPQERISKDAVKVWRISSLISNISVIAVLAVLIFLYNYSFDLPFWVGMVLYIITAIVILHAIYGIFISPVFLQRTWRYGIDEEHIQMKHGFFQKHHLIVPMTKVQYVNTNQGPLLRKFGLSTITIGTMASSHEIPAIPEAEAVKWRNQIAYLAKIKETDE